MAIGKHGRHADRYVGKATMAIPPLDEHLEKFTAGTISIGVEYRILTDDIIKAAGLTAVDGMQNLNDSGVSLHVFAKAADGDLERLRFDCFEDDPHFHYISWEEITHDVIYLDPVVTGDLLAWALNAIRTRLPEMLTYAGVEEAAQLVDQAQLETILPQVAEAAYRARDHSDRAAVESSTLAMGAVAHN